jgi:hypothetical protein
MRLPLPLRHNLRAPRVALGVRTGVATAGIHYGPLYFFIFMAIGIGLAALAR